MTGRQLRLLALGFRSKTQPTKDGGPFVDVEIFF